MIGELSRRVAYLLRRRRMEAELAEEIRLHVELRAAQLRAAGMRDDDALRAARKRVGEASLVIDACHEQWSWRALDGTLRELRHSARQLARAPLFAAVTVLTIAFGTGLATAAFTVYDAVALRPLAVRAPREIVRLRATVDRGGETTLRWSDYETIRGRARSLGGVIATSSVQRLVGALPGAEDHTILTASVVSSDYFAVLGVPAALGRVFGGGDEPAVVVSDAFWRRALHADSAAIGRTLTVGDARLTIVGVAPASFVGTGAPPVAPDLWVSSALQRALMPGVDWLHDDAQHPWEVLARLTPDASPSQADGELQSLARAIAPIDSQTVTLHARRATTFQTDSGEFEAFGVVCTVLMVAVGLILASGCTNLVSLLAARNAAREREITMRLTLGASRWRLARQLCAETLALSLAGGASGTLVSSMLCRWLRAWIVNTAGSLAGGAEGLTIDLTVNWHVLAYAALLSLVVGLAVGLWPALRATRHEASAVLKQGASTDGRAPWGRRNVLLAAQVAGSLVLLTGAGLLFGGVSRAGRVDPGFDARHMLVLMVDRAAVAPSPSARAALRDEIVRRTQALAAVRGVAWAERGPFMGSHSRSFSDAGNRGARATIFLNSVSGDYFATTGIALVAGRTFTPQEVASGAPLVIVSESLARRRWPHESPLGRSVTPDSPLAGPDTTRAYTVIGVAKDVRTTFLSRPDPAVEYFPIAPNAPQTVFLLRTFGAPAAAEREVLRALAAVDARLPSQTRLFTEEDGPMALQRLMASVPATVASALAGAGLLLASLGVAGLLFQVVARRTREIGVHIALGARTPQVIAMVLRRTLRPVAWGAALGLLGAAGVSALLARVVSMPDAPDFTYGGDAFDVRVFAGVLATLGAVVVVAALVPTRRALRVDPTIALRAE